MPTSKTTTNTIVRQRNSLVKNRGGRRNNVRRLERYDAIDRQSALVRIQRFVFECLAREDDLALHEFWGDYLEQADEMPEALHELSANALDAWTFFDRPLEDGRTVADALLELDAVLGAGELSYLRAMRQSTMHLWIVEQISGSTLTLRDALEQRRVSARAPATRRPFQRDQWIAARVLPRGASGVRELEQDLLPIPDAARAGLRAELSRIERDFMRLNPGSDRESFYKTLPPYFHKVWVESVLGSLWPDEPKTLRSVVLRGVHDELEEHQALEYLANHYRAWLDEPVPAFDGKTPREAAKLPELRSSLLALLHALSIQYEHALTSGDVAYDTSWLWTELGLDSCAS